MKRFPRLVALLLSVVLVIVPAATVPAATDPASTASPESSLGSWVDGLLIRWGDWLQGFGAAQEGGPPEPESGDPVPDSTTVTTRPTPDPEPPDGEVAPDADPNG